MTYLISLALAGSDAICRLLQHKSGIPEKLVMDSTCLWGSFMCWSTMHGETESLPCSLVSGLQRGNSA